MGGGGKGKGRKGLNLAVLDRGVKIADLVSLHGHLHSGLDSAEFEGADQLVVRLTKTGCDMEVLPAGSDGNNPDHWITLTDFQAKLLKSSAVFKEATIALAKLDNSHAFHADAMDPFREALANAKSEQDITVVFTPAMVKRINKLNTTLGGDMNDFRIRVRTAAASLSLYHDKEEQHKKAVDLIAKLTEENFDCINCKAGKEILLALADGASKELQRELGKTMSKSTSRASLKKSITDDDGSAKLSLDNLKRGTMEESDSQANLVFPKGLTEPTDEANADETAKWARGLEAAKLFRDRIWVLENLNCFAFDADDAEFPGFTAFDGSATEEQAISVVLKCFTTANNHRKPSALSKKSLELPAKVGEMRSGMTTVGGTAAFPFVTIDTLDALESVDSILRAGFTAAGPENYADF